MTSSYSIKVSKISNNGIDFVLPTNNPSLDGFALQNQTGTGITSWQDPSGGNLIGGAKIFVHGRRVRGRINNTLSTLMIERSSIMFGSEYLSGDPNSDNLYWDTFTVPYGYDNGIWYFDTSGWKCGPGAPGVRMTGVRPSGPTIVYNQNIQRAIADCGVVVNPHLWDGFQGGDTITFQINENNGFTTPAITDPTVHAFGKITIIWYPKNATYQSSGSLAVGSTIYTTGTATQTGNTVTGAGGANFPTSVVGGMIIYPSTNLYATITSWVSSTELTVDISQTIAAGSSYIIYYSGTVFNGSSDTTSTSQIYVSNNTNQIVLGSSPNLTNITPLSLPTGNTTISLPTTTTQLVGLSETATLSNKTFTNPTINNTSAITHNSIIVDTGTTDTQRTSASTLLTYMVGNISEVIHSMLITGVGNGLASGWTNAGGTLQVGQGNSSWARILVSGNGATLTYTSPGNLATGVYRVTYGIEGEGNRGIHLIQYRANGDATYYTLRSHDAYYNNTGIGGGSVMDIFEDYFTVTTAGNPFNFRITCNGRNPSAAAFIAGICFSLIVHKLG